MGTEAHTFDQAASAALEADLRRDVEGPVHFDQANRVMYACDASHYRQVPIGVVAPRSIDDLEAAVAVCRRHGAPLLCRGGGTSVAGQGCNLAVVLNTSRYLNRIIELDPQARRARVQPGLVLDDLRDAAEAHHLTFGPDPSTHASCTLGGMIGNNSCGVHSLMAGKTAQNVEELVILTYDGLRMRVGATDPATLGRIVATAATERKGAIYASLCRLRDANAQLIRSRYPPIPRRVSGYNLDELLPENGFHVARALVGSEGTCVTILEATLRLVQSPPCRTLVVLGYPDIAAAGDEVPFLLEHGPIGLEGMADTLVKNMKVRQMDVPGLALLPPGASWLFLEFGGQSDRQARDRARTLVAALEKRGSGPSVALLEDPHERAEVWSVREAGFGASSRLPDGHNTEEGWEDAAVSPDRLGDYLRSFGKLLDRHGYRSVQYGHFGQGLVHARIDFDLASAPGISRYRSFVEEAARLVVDYGGTLSGEHGDGQARGELLEVMFGPELVAAFGQFKAIWDPDGKMNPGKVVDPLPLDQNLRLGPDYRLPQLDTHFHFPDDERNFARATARCIGVGKCRRLHGGTMCPSYQVTHEEHHSTRGRARLLQEMCAGNLPDGWHNDQVKASLDLCLACKGCKRDCPAGVDVATYKAEFLSHYYRRRLRPRHAYAFGLAPYWAAAAATLGPVASLMSRMGPLAGLAKLAAGMAPQRVIPTLAPQTFRRWFDRQPARNGQGFPKVLLWVDTFTNYFEPHIGKAAVAVLEAAGFAVTITAERLCCGRPLYDYGMLHLARRTLLTVLNALGRQVADQVPVIVLEPSCAAVFRDELVNLLPDAADARRLSRLVFTLGEFLQHHAGGYEPPQRKGPALLHAHCHQKSVLDRLSDARLLTRSGLELSTPDTGCCGMAGSFGFEKAHYDLSVQIAEHGLLPAIRQSEPEALLVADGFSCRQQIAQLTDRRAVHLAEVLAPGGAPQPVGV